MPGLSDRHSPKLISLKGLGFFRISPLSATFESDDVDGNETLLLYNLSIGILGLFGLVSVDVLGKSNILLLLTSLLGLFGRFSLYSDFAADAPRRNNHNLIQTIKMRM